jgi:hypothetical protein
VYCEEVELAQLIVIPEPDKEKVVAVFLKIGNPEVSPVNTGS